MSLLSYMAPPRLCHLKKWPTFAGYGFNLHAEKGKAGQYIGKVDPDSPAELGGLKPNDYLIEVNGTNVEDQTHQKVVERVKEMSDMVNMLVVDVETYKYCKEKGIVLSSDMPEVVTHFTPETQPSKTSNSYQEIQSVTAFEHQESKEEPLSSEFQTTEEQKSDTPQDSSTIEVEEEEVADLDSVLEAVEHSQPPYHRSESPPVAETREQQPSQAGNRATSAAAPTGNGSAAASKDPVANISLDDMRARLGNSRRNQVKMNQSTFSEKMHMFQAL